MAGRARRDYQRKPAAAHSTCRRRRRDELLVRILRISLRIILAWHRIRTIIHGGIRGDEDMDMDGSKGRRMVVSCGFSWLGIVAGRVSFLGGSER